MKEKYYITTAITYASAKPHIGNTYEIVLTDAVARYKRAKGFDVYFQTGTDEHGEKVENNALKEGVQPQEYVDKISAIVKSVWDIMDTSYDRFIRTSDPIHKKQTQIIFAKLQKNGDIYKGKYNGWYCVACESFFTETQMEIEGICPDCGRSIDKKSEEAYFFKLSNYQDKLMEHIENNPDFLQPVMRKNEMINNFLKPGLQDLCVTRKSVKWGIEVLGDSEHVIYVWIDALSNYITFLNSEDNGQEFKDFWPADVQIVGKDIFRFHALYWPIMLMALGYELPKKVFGHPWLLLKDGKMSKSTGNVIYADELVEKIGINPVRYFMIHEMPFQNDGVYSHELLIERTNSDLVNIIGNLVNRTISMVNQYFAGSLIKSSNVIDDDFKSNIISKVNDIDLKMDDLRVSDALENVVEIFRLANKYVDVTTPWILKKEGNNVRLGEVLYNLIEVIRIGSLVMMPYLPDYADKIMKQINLRNFDYENAYSFGYFDDVQVSEASIIINRIDMSEMLGILNETNN